MRPGPAGARSRPRVPRAGPRSCVPAPGEHRRVSPGAPGGKIRSAHGRAGGPAARRGAERRAGAAAAGSAGTSPRQTGGQAGGRRWPRVRAGAGAPRTPPPARGLGSPRPVPEPPAGHFPCRSPGSGGGGGRLFRAGLGNKRGHAAAAPSEVSAGTGRAGGCPRARGAAGRGGGGTLAHLLPAGRGSRPLRPGPPLLRRLGKGGGEAPAGARRGLDPPRGEAFRSPRPGSPWWGEGRPRGPRGAGACGEGRRDLGPPDT